MRSKVLFRNTRSTSRSQDFLQSTESANKWIDVIEGNVLLWFMPYRTTVEAPKEDDRRCGLQALAERDMKLLIVVHQSVTIAYEKLETVTDPEVPVDPNACEVIGVLLRG